jgi:lipopolysaccharide export system permease protein
MNSTLFKPSFFKRWRLLPVLDRMVILELTKTVLAVLTVLVTIIVSRKFLAFLTKAIDGEIAGGTLMTLLGLKFLGTVIIFLPAAQFLGLLMVFGRMYRDQEMAVLASSGVGYGRLYRAIAWFLIPLCLVSAYLSLEVLPWSEAKVQSLLRQDEKTADLRGIKPGKFNEFSRGDVVLYAESLDETDGLMKKIFVQSRSGDKNGVTVAESGYLKKTASGSHFVVLDNGIRNQGTPGEANYIISEFDEYAVKIDADSDDDGNVIKREATIPSAQLWKSKTPRELAELQRRLAVPFGVLMLGLLAIPISRVAPRSGIYGNVVTAFLIFVVYFNLQSVSQGLLINGKVPLWLAFSGVYLLMLALTVFNLLKSIGWRWCWQVITGRTGI